MRVVDRVPADAALVSFEVEVAASSEAEARAQAARWGARQLHPPFTEALGVASDTDLGLLTRVAALGARGIVCVITGVRGAPPRFTVSLTAYPGRPKGARAP